MDPSGFTIFEIRPAPANGAPEYERLINVNVVVPPSGAVTEVVALLPSGIDMSNGKEYAHASVVLPEPY
jgi:hypothetical protein